MISTLVGYWIIFSTFLPTVCLNEMKKVQLVSDGIFHVEYWLRKLFSVECWNCLQIFFSRKISSESGGPKQFSGIKCFEKTNPYIVNKFNEKFLAINLLKFYIHSISIYLFYQKKNFFLHYILSGADSDIQYPGNVAYSLSLLIQRHERYYFLQE